MDFKNTTKKVFAWLNRQRPMVAILLLIVIGGGIIYFLWQGQPKQLKPMRSPQPPQPVKNETRKDYLICVARGQIATGYTEPSAGPPSASSRPYFIGSIAVHPLSSTAWGGDPRQPLIPFGTEIHLLNPRSLKVSGKWFDSLVVLDTGDVNYALWSNHPYWFDVYFGPTQYWTHLMARAFGTKKVDYYWVEEWR